MKKDNFYKIIIVCLLLLNIGMLCWLWFGGPLARHGAHPRPDRIIIDKLKLDEQQQQEFEALKNEHHSQMMAIQQEDGRLHDQLFGLLQKEPVDSNAENDLLKQIEENNLRKERVTFDHFRKVQAILRADQKPLFDELVKELSKQIMGQGPPRDGPPHEGPPPGERP